ncbi:DUF2892 domain-containing protein [uncultured Maricaulis sp.]|uniref:YgaP family membrane protein n=1 Tax=uncultured Maricaulis sp. TaxID=174710 RepID=UPI0030D878A5|tara:strand:+ start:9465 stop:9653 length:189 start_codon:yes stop_codon:yes gene_type:complete
MTINSAVRLLAGSMVLISIALSIWVHPYWIALAIFVGFNLVQSSFTGFCPPSIVLRKFGLKD